MTEDEIVGWHHRLNGHEFEQALGDGEGQRSLACCSTWGCKKLGQNQVTEQEQQMPSATTWINLEIVILGDVSQRKTYYVTLLYVESKGVMQMNLSTNRVPDVESKLMVTRSKGQGRHKLGNWD